MSYVHSQLTLKYYSLENNIYTEIPADDSKQEYIDMMLDFSNIQQVESIPSEILLVNFEKLKNEVKNFLIKKKTDGESYFNEIELTITMELAGMLLTELMPVSGEIDTILYKPLNLIKNGDFFSAMMLFQNPSTLEPTIPIVLEHWENIKTYTINYFNENYPTETIE